MKDNARDSLSVLFRSNNSVAAIFHFLAVIENCFHDFLPANSNRTFNSKLQYAAESTI